MGSGALVCNNPFEYGFVVFSLMHMWRRHWERSSVTRKFCLHHVFLLQIRCQLSGMFLWNPSDNLTPFHATWCQILHQFHFYPKFYLFSAWKSSGCHEWRFLHVEKALEVDSTRIWFGMCASMPPCVRSKISWNMCHGGDWVQRILRMAEADSGEI